MHGRFAHPPPPLSELGTDLVRITPVRRVATLLTPFAIVAAYFTAAHYRIWPLAVLSLVYLSFCTYGSISHDLVHRTLGLPRRINDFFLTVIELLAFRSGHAYRLAHLHHHARFPHDDDVEGAAARMSFARTLLEGMLFTPKITVWALRHHAQRHPIVAVEAALVVALVVACVALIPVTPIFAVYAALMLMGHWAIPLITSYVPHNAEGRTALTQTKLFRGKVASVIALQHLYHLEHHLYPQVPHHHWPKLAKRLDPYFRASGVEPVVLGF
jgi:beta-carotene hydroxylase